MSPLCMQNKQLKGWHLFLSNKPPSGRDRRQTIDWRQSPSGRCLLCTKHRCWSSRRQIQWNMFQRCMPGRCWTGSHRWRSSTCQLSTPHSLPHSSWWVALSGLEKLGWSSSLPLQNILHCTCSCTGRRFLLVMQCWQGICICYPACTSCLARMICIGCRCDKTGSGNIRCMKRVRRTQCW